jgi:hypothetical protein
MTIILIMWSTTTDHSNLDRTYSVVIRRDEAKFALKQVPILRVHNDDDIYVTVFLSL